MTVTLLRFALPRHIVKLSKALLSGPFAEIVGEAKWVRIASGYLAL